MNALCQPARVYHGLHHINQLLIDAQRYWTREADRTALNFAILYHDAVYDPLARDNEELSAQMWERESQEHPLGTMLASSFCAQIATAIRATANHFERPADLLDWQHAMLDLDLGGLGAAPNIYKANGLLIDEEYRLAGVTPEQFRAGRKGFLEHALAHRRYYRVHLDREEQAQANLDNDLACLA